MKEISIGPNSVENNTAPKLSILVETSCWLWNHILARWVPAKICRKPTKFQSNKTCLINGEKGFQHFSPEHLQRVDATKSTRFIVLAQYSAGTCSDCFIAYLFARLYSNNRFIPRISSHLLMFVFLSRNNIICWLSTKNCLGKLEHWTIEMFHKQT